jgi:hypothetical protein
MLDEELWVYMDLNFNSHDFYSHFLSNLGIAKNPAFS